MKNQSRSKLLYALCLSVLIVSCATGPAAGSGATVGRTDDAADASSFGRAVDLAVFPVPEGGVEELVTARGSGQLSLAQLGDAVDGRIDDAFKSANYYLNLGEYERAQRVLNYTLYLAADLEAMLGLQQFDQIMTARAYALADLSMQEKAIEVYSFREAVLFDRDDWERRLPSGLVVDLRVPDEQLAEMKAMLFQDRAISYTVLNRFEDAWADVEQSVAYSSEMEDWDRVAWTYSAFVQNAFAMENYEAVVRAYEPFASFTVAHPDAVGADQLLPVFRLASLANLNLGDYEEALRLISGLLTLKERMNYEDEYADFDRQLQDALRQEVGDTPRSASDAALSTMVRNNDVAGVRRLLGQGVDPDQRDGSDTQTPLMHAVQSSTETTIIDMLIAAGADVSETDEDGWTPLIFAARANPNPEVIRTLVAAGADPNARGAVAGATALVMAAGYTDNYSVVQELLSAGADPNSQSNAGFSILMLLARSPDSERMMRILLDAGADPNLQTSDGLTALTMARGSGNSEIAEILRSSGARE